MVFLDCGGSFSLYLLKINLLFPKIKDSSFHEITSLNIQYETILKFQTSEPSTVWFVWFCCVLKLCRVFCLKGGGGAQSPG